MAIQPQFEIQCSPNQNPTRLFLYIETEQLILKSFVKEMQRARMVKKRMKMEGLHYLISRLINYRNEDKCSTGLRADKQNRVENSNSPLDLQESINSKEESLFNKRCWTNWIEE